MFPISDPKAVRTATGPGTRPFVLSEVLSFLFPPEVLQRAGLDLRAIPGMAEGEAARQVLFSRK